MSTEDYDDVPGFGGGIYGFSNVQGSSIKKYKCFKCQQPVIFKDRKPFNLDGTQHRCIGARAAQAEVPETPQQAVLFAMAAMNAIISASIQSAGVDFIHSMNFYDVADASWRVAAAMVSKEKAFSDEFGGG